MSETAESDLDNGNMKAETTKTVDSQGNNTSENQTADVNEYDDDYELLNSQLDQLNTLLDVMEQKNDQIHAQLLQLLECNRETRKQFEQNRNSKSNNA